ncbi:uncharacterized protein LOC121233447 [Aquila chrysaetos chrysaetos]|uniref:uncharacterized protein LOC121233447 n=1 Tax=Aquila chrysaetos chrysaetos TaxID=223781 RepID=UPI001B7D37A5|nr:uncharacterized protein LOC121233447 [Aquila chrysaetos chrysaetos]
MNSGRRLTSRKRTKWQRVSKEKRCNKTGEDAVLVIAGCCSETRQPEPKQRPPRSPQWAAGFPVCRVIYLQCKCRIDETGAAGRVPRLRRRGPWRAGLPQLLAGRTEGNPARPSRPRESGAGLGRSTVPQRWHSPPASRAPGSRGPVARWRRAGGRAGEAAPAASLGDAACPAGRAGQRRVSSAAGAALPAAGCFQHKGGGARCAFGIPQPGYT